MVLIACLSRLPSTRLGWGLCCEEAGCCWPDGLDGKCSGSRRSMKQHIVQPAARSLPPAGFSKEVGWGGVSLASSSLSRHIETTDNGMR